MAFSSPSIFSRAWPDWFDREDWASGCRVVRCGPRFAVAAGENGNNREHQEWDGNSHEGRVHRRNRGFSQVRTPLQVDFLHGETGGSTVNVRNPVTFCPSQATSVV